MKFLDIFKRKDHPVIKACLIYKKDNCYKIVTQSETKAGFLLSVEPIFIVQVNSPIEELELALFQSLNSSKKNIPVPKREEYPLLEKEELMKLKEKSYNSLYKTSNSCDLRLENNILKIFPEKFYNPKKPSQGLVFVEEDMFEIDDPENHKKEVVTKVMELLEKDYKGIGSV